MGIDGPLSIEMKHPLVWQFIRDALARRDPVVLLMVLDHSTGSPGRRGFKLAVTRDGRTCGTIGGGPMEFAFLQKAQADLNQSRVVHELVPQIHQSTKGDHRSGMICSGSQMVFVKTLGPDDRSNVDAILTGQGRQLTITPTRFAIDVPTIDPNGFYGNQHDWLYRETIGPEMRIYIAGGGHVGLAVARVFDLLDAEIVLFDHRPDLSMATTNPYAHKLVIGPYQQMSQHVEGGMRSYGIVVSTSFRTDLEALREFSKFDLRYLGAMGSPTKIAYLLNHLRQEGVPQALLQGIHAPIGLPIHSHTTDEIAISIAAEIIGVKNGPPEKTAPFLGRSARMEDAKSESS